MSDLYRNQTLGIRVEAEMSEDIVNKQRIGQLVTAFVRCILGICFSRDIGNGGIEINGQCINDDKYTDGTVIYLQIIRLYLLRVLNMIVEVDERVSEYLLI